MDKVKVLIADDSLVQRSQIREALFKITGLEIIGAFSNGKLALERMQQVSVDLLILDLLMPEMDGIAVLKELKHIRSNCKVIIFAGASKREADSSFEALNLGACDVVAKPTDLKGESPSEKIRELLEPKIRALFPQIDSNFPGPTPQRQPDPQSFVNKQKSVNFELLFPKVLVIGASTGGPTVLEYIFSKITGPLLCPIIIVQHMPAAFTSIFSGRLALLSGLDVREAVHGEPFDANRVYVAPGNFHLILKQKGEKLWFELNQEKPINSVRPAVDPLFQTAADIFKEKCLAVVLTGMGRDGRDGAIAIKDKNGGVVIQTKESCVVFGMPGAVMEAGAYDKIASPDEIISILEEKVASRKTV